MKIQKVLLTMAFLAAAATGCKSTVSDIYTADTDTRMIPADFKPTVEVMKDKGLVKGYAEEAYVFWIWPTEYPTEFANPSGSGFNLVPGLKDAAIYDACKKSGANILLAPRFTIYRETSFLWFSGKTRVTVEGVPARLVGAEELKDQGQVVDVKLDAKVRQ